MYWRRISNSDSEVAFEYVFNRSGQTMYAGHGVVYDVLTSSTLANGVNVTFPYQTTNPHPAAFAGVVYPFDIDNGERGFVLKHGPCTVWLSMFQSAVTNLPFLTATTLATLTDADLSLYVLKPWNLYGTGGQAFYTDYTQFRSSGYLGLIQYPVTHDPAGAVILDLRGIGPGGFVYLMDAIVPAGLTTYGALNATNSVYGTAKAFVHCLG